MYPTELRYLHHSPREHGSLLGIKQYPFSVDSSWYQGKTSIASFEPEELFGTKLRALLQRRKNRDLFDLNEGLKQLAMSSENLIACFDHYLKLEGKPITRETAEQRMLEKLTQSDGRYWATAFGWGPIQRWRCDQCI
jgi:predicted nucleotidyltransferase component of viral defense system